MATEIRMELLLGPGPRLAALVLATLAIAFGACGGGGDNDPASLEEYLGLYEEIDNRADAATDELDAEYADVLSQSQLTDENRPDVQSYFEQLEEIGQTYVDQLSELDPPEEAQTIHDESIASYQHVLDLFEDARGGIGQVTSLAGLQALFDTAEMNDALAAANEDCAELQQLADDNNIDVDYECQGSDDGSPTPLETP